MKVILEIDLPYINEDGEIESSIQEQIVDGAIRRMYSSLDAKIKPIIDAEASKIINTKIDEIFNNFLERPITISNGYKKEEFDSVIDMVEQKFSALYDQKFAQASTCNGQDPILKKINDSIDYKVKSLVENLNKKIELEAKTLADKAVKESDLYGVLQKAGVIK